MCVEQLSVPLAGLMVVIIICFIPSLERQQRPACSGRVEAWNTVLRRVAIKSSLSFHEPTLIRTYRIFYCYGEHWLVAVATGVHGILLISSAQDKYDDFVRLHSVSLSEGRV